MSIKKEITHKYQMIFLKVSNFYFKKALNNLVENQVIQKHEDKYKFRLVPKSQKKTQEKTKSKKLKQVLKKKIIKNVAKKIVARPKKQLTNRANSSNSQKKTITENKAVNSKSEYKKGDAIWQYFDRYNPEVSVQNTDGWLAFLFILIIKIKEIFF